MLVLMLIIVIEGWGQRVIGEKSAAFAEATASLGGQKSIGRSLPKSPLT